MEVHLHQKTSLTAGTITHDDKLATDFGHLEVKRISKRWKLGLSNGIDSK